MLRNLAVRATRGLSTAAAPAPKNVAITGAAGSIGYALVMRVASGQVFGPETPVNLSLIETEPGMKPLNGVIMEMMDGAFPLLRNISATSDPSVGFGDADAAFLVGAQPRGKGMERADLLSANAAIFATQGAALNASARRGVQVLVVGNPANTNALVASHNAPDISPGAFHAMTRLDQNRAMAQVASKTGIPVRAIERVVVWGNHSATQFPDLSHALVHGAPALKIIDDNDWVKNEFVPRVQKRGAEIINARGASSAASAASAAIDHMRDLFVGSGSAWQSMAVPSDGSYGIDEGIWYSVPCTCDGDGVYTRVAGLPEPDDYAAAMMDATRKELIEERDAVLHLLPKSGAAPTAPKRGRKRKTKS